MPPAITGTIGSKTRPSRALPPIVESDPPPNQPSHSSTLIPTTKRARDEELEDYALKLRKEIEVIQGPLPDDEDNDEGEIPQIVKRLPLVIHKQNLQYSSKSLRTNSTPLIS